jgi:sugar phosphate isomerase/epimerase
MKYGVNLMVWTMRVGEAQSTLCSGLREWGFDGVELFLSPEEPANIPAVKRMLEGANLERTTCSVLPREAHLVSPRAEVRAR